MLIIGFLLGGTVGISTVISSIGLGYCIQFIFKLFKFNVSDVSHRYIIDDIKSVKKFKNSKNQNELTLLTLYMKLNLFVKKRFMVLKVLIVKDI